MKKKLIIDVDTGVDDALAIMLALADPNVEVLAITCCHGNTPLENVLKNTLRVLKVCNRLDIPVYRGCSHPLLARKQHASDYHGKDGLGDVPDPDAPGLDLLQKRKAVQAMIKTVKEHPDEVTLVATAPLTNLAVAVQLDPSFPKKLKALYIMGGNTDSRGNPTVCGEFNFVADPEAAYIVLDRFTCPTCIATWEFSCKNSLPWSFCDKWLAQKSKKAEFTCNISRLSRERAQSAEYQKEITSGKGFNSCDCYANGCGPRWRITDRVGRGGGDGGAGRDLHPRYDGGGLHGLLLKKKHKAFVMKTFDLEKFKQTLMNSLKDDDTVTR